MTRWMVVPNPEFEGMEPRIVRASCHDGSNFLTMQCPWCQRPGHVHESQVVTAPVDAIIAILCHMCGNVSDVEIATFLDAFAKMRAQGWIE